MFNIVTVVAAFTGLVSGCASSPKTIGEATRQINFDQCQALEIKRSDGDKQPTGIVKVEFVNDVRGNLLSVRTIENTTGSKSLADCIEGLIRSTSFPAEGGKDNIVSTFTRTISKQR